LSHETKKQEKGLWRRKRSYHGRVDKVARSPWKCGKIEEEGVGVAAAASAPTPSSSILPHFQGDRATLSTRPN